MSSLAQEESRSISENERWGWKRRIAAGKVTMSYGLFLGYKRGKDGIPEIVEEEAQVVRFIYQAFLNGTSLQKIANYLMSNGIPTPAGKTKWWQGGVKAILNNEKYKGHALLQKTYIEGKHQITHHGGG